MDSDAIIGAIVVGFMVGSRDAPDGLEDLITEIMDVGIDEKSKRLLAAAGTHRSAKKLLTSATDLSRYCRQMQK
jgi:hypothetical protein